MLLEAWFDLLWPPILAISTLLAATAASLHLILSRRNTSSTIAWIGLIALLPIFGASSYVLFGINRIRRKANAMRARSVSPSEQQAREVAQRIATEHIFPPEQLEHPELCGLATLAERVTRAPLLSGNSIELMRDGDDVYPAMLKAIRGARRSITLSVYIFNNDEAGRQFVEALADALARGVKVHIMVDSVGAHYAHPTAVKLMRARGLHVATFMPILRPGSFAFLNLRTHRKIMVVDGELGFTGGINIRQEHVLLASPKSPTHDTHFRVRGPLVHHLQLSNAEDWHFCTGEVLSGEEYFPHLKSAGEVRARGIQDGPDEEYENLLWILQGALASATTHVVIMTPYFLPDQSLLDALQVTAMRGVKVDIILPERSNLVFIDHASRPNWQPLLEHGCNIWLTPEPFDHSKLMVVDEHWSLLGSANWDPRSLRLNFEFNVEAYDDDLAAAVLQLAHDKLASARQVTLEDYKQRGVLSRVRDGIWRLFTPYL